MGVNNSLVQKNNDKLVTYKAGDESVSLSPYIIRNFLTNGDTEKVSDQEIVMFLNLCRYQHLNPYLREAYLVKYGTSPATIVTGKDAFSKRAQRNAKYKGIQAGVVVQRQDNTLEYRVGSLTLSGETLVGGWAKVFVHGYEEPVEISVAYGEYEGKKYNKETHQYEPNSQWKSKPATMIRKVAYVQALREAFPDDFAGMYEAEEIGVDANLLPDAPVNLPPAPGEIPEDTPPPPDDYDPLG